MEPGRGPAPAALPLESRPGPSRQRAGLCGAPVPGARPQEAPSAGGPARRCDTATRGLGGREARQEKRFSVASPGRALRGSRLRYNPLVSRSARLLYVKTELL